MGDHIRVYFLWDLLSDCSAFPSLNMLKFRIRMYDKENLIIGVLQLYIEFIKLVAKS